MSTFPQQVEHVNAIYEAIERLQKDEKEPRAKIGRDDKELRPEDVALLTAMNTAIEALRKKKVEALGTLST